MKLIIQGLVLLAFAGLVQAETVEEQAGQDLEMQNIKTVNRDNGTLRVVTNTLQLTEQRYREVIAGLCQGSGDAEENLEGVNEIRVLNAFAKQGYAFEGGAKACREWNEAPESESDAYISSITRKVRN